ncbi:MAG: PAS domain S-box protein [Verrucomicrobia bacterium]|nr:PAS domain S-box protein [Verrucomicrobiota bacterium]
MTRNFLRTISIKRKLIWIIMLASGVALLIACAAFVTYEIIVFRRSAVQDLTTLGQIMADSCAVPLSFDNEEEARRTLQTLQAKEHIAAACIRKNDGEVFASYPTNKPLTDLDLPLPRPPGHQFRGQFLDLVWPIVAGNETIGTVYLKSNLAEMYDRFRGYVGIVAAVFVCSSAIALVLSAQLQRVISRPILHLAQTSRVVSEQKNYSRRAVKESEDELGELIDAFNHMLQQIQQRDAELQKAHDELEKRVGERTRELQEEVLERKRAEQAARTSELKFRSVVESAYDAIVLADLQGRIILWNKGAELIFGYSEQEVVGQPLTTLMPERFREDHLRGLERFRATRVPHVIGKTVELEGLRKDGTEFPLELSLSTWEVSEQMVFSGIIRDITERKRTYEQLQSLAAKLTRSNNELQAFAYVASHDLQEPLRKVQAFGDRLKAICGHGLKEEGRDYLDRMLNAAKRMHTLINDLLLFSRVNTQANPFQKVSLCRIIREVLSDLEIRIQQTGAKVELGELATLEADPLQMRQLFQNLISNALKFHRPGVSPVVKIHGRLLETPGAAGAEQPSPNRTSEILVEDNGIGFDERYLDRIFGVFQRLHGRQDYEGTGIGLAICRKIVERHGGTITARSAPDKGATFIVKLPLSQNRPA